MGFFVPSDTDDEEEESDVRDEDCGDKATDGNNEAGDDCCTKLLIDCMDGTSSSLLKLLSISFGW